MSLPPFTGDGLLPNGDFPMTFAELRASYLVTGAGLLMGASWDKDWRAHLVDNLEVLVGQLWDIGVDQIFVDGSFAEDKDHPNDIDGYFECDAKYFATGQLQRDLNIRDPHKVWTWDSASRRMDQNGTKRQLPMWHRYRVELYPHYPGCLSGVRDLLGRDLQFPALFRQSRPGFQTKGIVQIIR